MTAHPIRNPAAFGLVGDLASEALLYRWADQYTEKALNAAHPDTPDYYENMANAAEIQRAARLAAANALPGKYEISERVTRLMEAALGMQFIDVTAEFAAKVEVER